MAVGHFPDGLVALFRCLDEVQSLTDLAGGLSWRQDDGEGLLEFLLAVVAADQVKRVQRS